MWARILFRPGATGGMSGPCPPQTRNAPPPKRGLFPKESNRLGATGAQFGAGAPKYIVPLKHVGADLI